MSASERKDPYRGYRFVIEIDGATRPGFTECLGLVADGNAVDYREGSEGPSAGKLAGLRKYGASPAMPGCGSGTSEPLMAKSSGRTARARGLGVGEDLVTDQGRAALANG
jgi:hypothetical protein